MGVFPGTVRVCFYAGTNEIDLAIRAVCRRPGQPFDDVPSHCALVFPSGDLYEMVAAGWQKRPALSDDLAWSYPALLPNMDAAWAWCEANRGRYRYWVDALILIMTLRLIRHRRVLPLLRHWHLAVRHICSVDALRALTEGGWPAPRWLTEQDCPASPNDLLFAVWEGMGAAETSASSPRAS